MKGQNLNVKYALDAVEAASKLGCKTFVGAGSQAEIWEDSRENLMEVSQHFQKMDME